MPGALTCLLEEYRDQELESLGMHSSNSQS